MFGLLSFEGIGFEGVGGDYLCVCCFLGGFVVIVVEVGCFVDW